MDIPSYRPLDALFRPPALIAVLLAGEALALVLALAPEPPAARLALFGLASLGIQWIAIGTLCALYLLRHMLIGLSRTALAWCCLGLLLTMSLLVGLAGWELFAPIGELRSRTDFLMRILAIAFVVGLLALLTYGNYWRARQLAVRAKQLELESLRARIRPHFLFNTLNTGAALVHAQPDEAERVLLDLADLFRAALREPEQVPLSREIELTTRYLEIEALRFGPRLRVSWSLPDLLPDVDIPALSLQPLAENAIRHGIERLPGGGNIDIRLRQDGGWISIEVENDMPTDGSRAAEGHNIGLNSARERVRALSDGHGDVETHAAEGKHLAVLRIPNKPPQANPGQATTR
ncbi:histidine kinase [Thermomonas sp. HDW16]|uniref:sensor histidine kinase n=1 Tax=Thermomonas sp. HDW16 TaxID=2714945 RepID=UPI001F0EDF66|nr:histidine kinase [Thermomonas sp. HDW16]